MMRWGLQCDWGRDNGGWMWLTNCEFDQLAPITWPTSADAWRWVMQAIDPKKRKAWRVRRMPNFRDARLLAELFAESYGRLDDKEEQQIIEDIKQEQGSQLMRSHITITIEGREDGGVSVHAPGTGIVLSGLDESAVFDDLGKALQVHWQLVREVALTYGSGD